MICFWEFIEDIEVEYHVHRKTIMEKFGLSAIEVDVILFLANNPQYTMAADISRARKLPKSHVSLAVNRLMQKGFLKGTADDTNQKKVCLIITEQAQDMISFGKNEQKKFVDDLFHGFTPKEKEVFQSMCNCIRENAHTQRYPGGDCKCQM